MSSVSEVKPTGAVVSLNVKNLPLIGFVLQAKHKNNGDA